jgi:hypothetical protein
MDLKINNPPTAPARLDPHPLEHDIGEPPPERGTTRPWPSPQT